MELNKLHAVESIRVKSWLIQKRSGSYSELWMVVSILRLEMEWSGRLKCLYMYSVCGSCVGLCMSDSD